MPNDYDLLEKIVKRYPKMLTTPNILTEVSNLLLQDEGKHLNALSTQLLSQIETIPEEYVPSIDAAREPAFKKFGLTDSAIYLLGKQGKVLLSVDAGFVAYSLRLGLKAVNFNYIRTPSLLE